MNKIIIVFCISVFSTLGAAYGQSSWLDMLQRAISANSRHTWDNGDRYKGEDRTNGMGAYYWKSSGDMYFGGFKENRRNGYGVYIWASGGAYVGNWTDGAQKEDAGTNYNASGNRTSGTNSEHRFETFDYNSGDKYIGETLNGRRNGYGVYLWKDGGMWFGWWKDGERDGEGIYIRHDNTVETGSWKGDNHTAASGGKDELQRRDDSPIVPNTVNKALLLRLVNEHRAKGCNCGGSYYSSTTPVAWSNLLEAAAYDHSVDMAANKMFSHTGSNGSSLSDRVKRRNYTYSTVGENIFMGRDSEEEAIRAWINSPGHCRNIMNPNFSEIGVAHVNTYWTMALGKPSN